MLTDAKLRKMNGKPIPKRIELSDANGLSVRVTAEMIRALMPCLLISTSALSPASGTFTT